MAHIDSQQLVARKVAIMEEIAKINHKLNMAQRIGKPLSEPDEKLIGDQLLKFQAEREDLDFLLGLTAFCPVVSAARYSPVHPPVAREQAPDKDKVFRSRKRQGPRPPVTVLELVFRRLSKRKVVSWEELEREILNCYNLKSLGEVLSVLKREYGVPDGRALLDQLDTVFSKQYRQRLFKGGLSQALAALVQTHERTMPPYTKVDARQGFKTPDELPQTPFEKRLLALGRYRRWGHWRQIGEHMRKIYAASNEVMLAQRVLSEYGLGWNISDIEYLRSHLCHFSWRYPKLLAEDDPRYMVRGWLYYFFMRLWIWNGRDDFWLIPGLPHPMEFNSPHWGDDGDEINRVDYDPEGFQKEIELQQREEKRSQRAARKARYPIRALKPPLKSKRLDRLLKEREEIENCLHGGQLTRNGLRHKVHELEQKDLHIEREKYKLKRMASGEDGRISTSQQPNSRINHSILNAIIKANQH